MVLDEFLSNDDMKINKTIDTVSIAPATATKEDYVSMLSKKKKAKKNTVSVYLDNDTLDKMKTICAREEISMSSAIETWIIELTKDVEVDVKMIKKYNKNKPGRR